jgi:hypothetical protein
MSELEQQSFLARPNVVRNIGIGLFLLSFIIPLGGFGNTDFFSFRPFAGFWIFVQTPELITALPLWRGPPIDDGFTPYEIFIRVIWLSAWSVNFTVFFRLPKVAAWIAIALPWAAFVCWFNVLDGFAPFYFWALGIAFIHFSRRLKGKYMFQD